MSNFLIRELTVIIELLLLAIIINWIIIYVHTYVATYNFILLSGHSLMGTHLFESSSMTIPVGHSHPSITQIAGQAINVNLLVHVAAH